MPMCTLQRSIARPQSADANVCAALQPYLKYHNPRTFEDLAAPVPNFRTLGLKAGEVPKFFDGVLSGRAQDSVAAVSTSNTSSAAADTCGVIVVCAAIGG